MRNYLPRIMVFVFVLCLSGCYMHAIQGTAIDNIRGTLRNSIHDNNALEQKKRMVAQPPAAISLALLPELSSKYGSAKQRANADRFDISVHDVPAKTFFMGLVEGTRYNMVVDPNITGTISLDLKNVTISEAMEAVRELYGFEYRRTAHGFDVLPETLHTQIFTVNYLDVQRTGRSSTLINSSQISDKVGSTTSGASPTNSNTPAGATTPSNSALLGSGSIVDTRSEVDFWKELEATLKTMVGSKDGRSIVMNPQASLVIVRAFPSEIHAIGNYLDRIQTNLERQVIIEAKILEVELSDDFRSGIDWGRIGNGLSQTGNLVSAIPANGQMFNLTVKGKYSTIINLLAEQGNVQVLSSPRISTLNNQQAVIKVGGDSFFVTSVTSNSTPSTTSSSVAQSQTVGLTPFFAGITLDVTPQISSGGRITLHVHPSVSTVRDQVKEINLGTSGGQANVLSLPLAQSTIRESDSIVHAESGQVIVIGGLMQNRTEEEIKATPGVSKIPFLGTLGRDTAQHSRKSELVILLQPCIPNNDSWSGKMAQSDARFRDINRGFHVGARPEVFGTMGEKPRWQP